MKAIIEIINEQILQGLNNEIEVSVQKALEDKIPAGEILKDGLIAAMGEVGRRFEAGDYFVPEMLISARAMKIGLGILHPYLIEEGVEARGKAVIGTVKGDLHDIGKNLVGIMLEGAGFEVVDLGTDVAPEMFAKVVREEKADILCLSALLTTTMEQMSDVIEAVEDIGVRSEVKILVGGAPLTAAFAEEIGADGYAPDESVATVLARNILMHEST